MTRAELVAAVLSRVDGMVDPRFRHVHAEFEGLWGKMWRCSCGAADGINYPRRTELCPVAVAREIEAMEGP